ncbi:MAG TPA: hypothetical protein PLW18_01450 [Candidatus Dojkabacteria bacterium]|jgi:antitoxin (DNA-binding transcriptional repressor) of toxin-antitoxin stability system|nr:hypothetical protein [Candidatus Dojkabacteria bacterium]
MNIEYKKINLRNFRQNLTQLKDSLNAGQAYEVIDRGKTLAYFIPSEYSISLTNKHKKQQEEYRKAITSLFGCVKMSEKKKKNFDYEKEYRKAMEKKHLR